MSTNGDLSSRSAAGQQPPLNRADETDDLLKAIQALVIPFIRAADTDAASKPTGHSLQTEGTAPRTTLVEHHQGKKLTSLLTDLPLPPPSDHGEGRDGFLKAAEQILHYSVNTWDQGFLDKLYASTTPVGLAADLLLSSLNTNLHVYQVSPALTVVEKRTARALAQLFGFKGANAGGVSQPGGSAANQSSIVIARNYLFPETKSEGYGSKRFVLFTSAHGHYSLEKAAQICGFGSNAVRSVAVDHKGCMRVDELAKAIQKARDAGETPFYVNATAGTTVLGSFDPLDRIADVCQREKLWMHVDGSWGSPVVFSANQRHKVAGIARADSIALCPHKMLMVPTTCSFLLAADLRKFHKGMTLPAGYLFHAPGDDDGADASAVDSASRAAHPNTEANEPRKEFWDLADLTPQCGRRGDALKLALSWHYYGTAGLGDYIDNGFAAAARLAALAVEKEAFMLVSENPPPCLQVCFYYAKKVGEGEAVKERNGLVTERIVAGLVRRGFMVDFAPGEAGRMFRVVVNGQTRLGTVEGLVRGIEEVGVEVVKEVDGQ